MQFNNIEDIKNFMLLLKNNCNEKSKWYNDLDWFSSINYTTTSEYCGELMLFVQKLIMDENMKAYNYELMELETVLKRMW